MVVLDTKETMEMVDLIKPNPKLRLNIGLRL